MGGIHPAGGYPPTLSWFPLNFGVVQVRKEERMSKQAQSQRAREGGLGERNVCKQVGKRSQEKGEKKFQDLQQRAVQQEGVRYGATQPVEGGI
jgi:hypothetical protein